MPADFPAVGAGLRGYSRGARQRERRSLASGLKCGGAGLVPQPRSPFTRVLAADTLHFYRAVCPSPHSRGGRGFISVLQGTAVSNHQRFHRCISVLLSLCLLTAIELKNKNRCALQAIGFRGR